MFYVIHFYIMYLFYNTPQSFIVTIPFGRPESVPYASIFLTISNPFVTLPKTTCLPFNHGVCAVQIKTINK